MKKQIINIIQQIVWICLIVGVIWFLVTYFTHWNELLTHKQWFVLEIWPVLLIILSYTSLVFMELENQQI